jgi:hypothetical protein
VISLADALDFADLDPGCQRVGAGAGHDDPVCRSADSAVLVLEDRIVQIDIVDVVVSSSDERIPARASAQDVVAAVAFKCVVTASAVEGIRSAIADELVGKIIAGQVYVAEPVASICSISLRSAVAIE